MDLFLLVALTLGLTVFALFKDPRLLGAGLKASQRLLSTVWIELALGFLLAGLVDVLVPRSMLIKWLGAGRSEHGILVGWAIGLILPGGPYVVFPMMAKLFAEGVSAGPLIALIAAKVLLSPIRMFTIEAPLMGWPITLARFLPALVVPPLLGWAGQWLFDLFTRRPDT